LSLVLIGWITIYSASYNPEHPSIFSFSEEYGKQFLFIIIGLLLAVAITHIDGIFFSRLSIIFYIITTLALVLVLLIGREINGATAWFHIGSFSLQPSEFSKVAISLLLAQFISSRGVKFRGIKTRLQAAAIVLIPAGLILLQPDAGTLLVFTAFIFAMYREGLSGNILIFGMASIVISVASIIVNESTYDYPFAGEASGIYLLLISFLFITVIAIFLGRNISLPRFRKKTTVNIISIGLFAMLFSGGIGFVMNSDKVIKDYQKDRILNTLGLLHDTQGKGYNLDKSKMAIGSGGLFGKGFHNGPLTKYHFVPEQSTDFIFTALAEEWGFAGSSLVVILYTFLILRLIMIAERQRSRFSRVYGYCAASIFFMHMLINVGMVMGLAPVIGIPLPFFSYGGSSFLALTILIFIMIRLDAERMSVLR
jgi:rod shape determining protein RodA